MSALGLLWPTPKFPRATLVRALLVSRKYFWLVLGCFHGLEWFFGIVLQSTEGAADTAPFPYRRESALFSLPHQSKIRKSCMVQTMPIFVPQKPDGDGPGFAGKTISLHSRMAQARSG